MYIFVHFYFPLFVHSYCIINSGIEYIKNLTIYEINMDKYKEILYNEDEEKIEENKYLIMLDMDKEELKKLKKDKVVEEYMEKIERLNQNPMFINWITKEKDEEMIKNTQIRRATEAGMDVGMKKLINEMLKNGMTIEQISKVINMKKADINKIIN